MRLAVLGNETAANKRFLHSFPVRIIGDEELARVLREGDWHEAETLVENPTVADDVLLALYRGDGLADVMDDERHRQLVAYTARNPRLQHRDDSKFGPDLGHWDLHKAIFAMLETVPTSKGWMQCLDFLLKQIDPHDACHPASVDHVLERWAFDESGKPPEPDRGHEYNDSGLDDRTEFRCLVSSLYGQIHSVGGRIEGSPDDEDVVRRCAYYGNARLDQKQVAAGFEKDGDVFVFAAMTNDNLLLNRVNRKFFEDECLTGRHLCRYKRRCAQLNRRWPSFDPRPTAEWMKEPAKEPQSELSEIRQQLAELNGQVSSLSKAATWLPWLIGGTAALVMWRS